MKPFLVATAILVAPELVIGWAVYRIALAVGERYGV